MKVESIILQIARERYPLNETQFSDLSLIMHRGFEIAYPEAKVRIEVVNGLAQSDEIKVDDGSERQQRELVLKVQQIKQHCIQGYMRGVRP